MYRHIAPLPFLLLRGMGLFVLLICIGYSCAAQTTALKPGTDTLLIRRLLTAADKPQADPDSVIHLCQEPLKLSIAGNYMQGAQEAWKLIAKMYSKKSDNPQAIHANKQALSYASSVAQKVNCYLNIGALYYEEGNYALSSASFDSGLNELQKEAPKDDPKAYFVFYNALAALNSHFKQDSNTLYYLDKAEDVARKEKLYFNVAVVLCNKASYFQDHRRLDSALKYMLEAKAINEKNNLKNNESEVDQGLGSIYFDSGLYEKAAAYFKAALAPEKLRYSEEPDNIEIFSSYGIAQSLFHLKRYQEAEAILVPAMRKAATLDVKESSMDAYSTLAEIYKATGQYKKALDCEDSIMVLKDSVYAVEKVTAFNQLQIKFQTAEKDKQLSQNQLMIAQQKNKIARKNIWLLSIGGSLLLLLLVSGAVYLQTIHKQKTLEKENEIGILKAAVAGGDNERSRIARELHDGIGGMLSAAMMRFSSMHHENPAITQTVAYRDAMGMLREMGDEIRKTAHNLMPDVLLKQSLPEAVRLFCNNVQEEGTLKIDFQAYGPFDELTQEYKLNLYRIIQELVKNAIIHSGADRVIVQFLQNENKLMVSVEDNGIGFSVNETKGGLGLSNIHTRVRSMDGHFTLESEPGKGTTAIIELELKPQAT